MSSIEKAYLRHLEIQKLREREEKKRQNANKRSRFKQVFKEMTQWTRDTDSKPS